MRYAALTTLAFSFTVIWPAASPQPHPKIGPSQIRLNGHTFTLPPGFEIELVAGPPLVDRPIVADFDEQGRLYVADSSGSNEKVAAQLEKKPHRVVRLEDTDGDGRFDKSTVFADRMMFPEGAMWLAGSLYVAAPPSIWKLTDADGDGVADRREEWFRGKTLTNCANDLHGPYAGPDGWIYWCKGAFAQQTYERPGRKQLVTRAAHVFRARPDGSGVEPVMTGGMDNPVEVAFTPGGERVFNCTFLQHPGNGQRDGLIHAIYGGVYGKDHDVIHDHPWTGPALMPPLTHLGAAAPSGLMRYESRAFGADYQDNLFTSLFNMRKVTRHALEAHGATFRSHDEDFLVSDQVDFHPTDVLEDADGSLLVIDTGGWYKLCCPTSQLVKPDVLGAIYRVRRTDAPRIDDPRGLKLAWATMAPRELAKLLDDARPAVRRRAVAALGAKGAEAVPAVEEVLRSDRSAEAKRNAVWTAARIDHAGARAAVRGALRDGDETVRQTAAHSVSVWRDRDAVPNLLWLLERPSQHNRRAAAEALGRIGDRAAVPALLAAAAKVNDRALEHSLTFALIEIADPKATAAGLTGDSTHARRAALTALDQMEGGGLKVEAVAKELGALDGKMRETAWWIAGRHADWGAALSGVLRERLGSKALSTAERGDLERHLAQFARSGAIQKLLAERLRDPSAQGAARQSVLRAMAQSGLREAPASWITALTEILNSADSELSREAVVTVRALRMPKARPEKLAAALLRIGGDDQKLAAVRLNALAAVPGGLSAVEPALFEFLRGEVTADRPVATRGLAADVIARARFKTAQLLTLTESLKSVGPLEMERVLDAFTQTADEKVGRALLASLKDSPVQSSLSVGSLRSRLTKYGTAVQKQAEEYYTTLDTDAGKQKAKFEELLSSLKSGDVRRGQLVFNGPKAACFSCHAIGYLGGKLGPDLTRIGGVRTERDLLESVVFPGASFVRGYEPVSVATRDGKLHNGIVRRDAAEEIVLALGADQEVRLPREEIEQMQPGRVSVMPSGLDQQLTRQELADLIAFLKACR